MVATDSALYDVFTIVAFNSLWLQRNKFIQFGCQFSFKISNARAAFRYERCSLPMVGFLLLFIVVLSPEDLQIVSTTTTGVTVKWSQSGLAPTICTVEISPINTSEACDCATSTCSITGLTPGAVYSVQITVSLDSTSNTSQPFEIRTGSLVCYKIKQEKPTNCGTNAADVPDNFLAGKP